MFQIKDIDNKVLSTWHRATSAMIELKRLAASGEFFFMEYTEE